MLRCRSKRSPHAYPLSSVQREGRGRAVETSGWAQLRLQRLTDASAAPLLRFVAASVAAGSVEAVEPLELKGKAEPVPAYRLSASVTRRSGGMGVVRRT
jgi:hypothetical protein